MMADWKDRFHKHSPEILRASGGDPAALSAYNLKLLGLVMLLFGGLLAYGLVAKWVAYIALVVALAILVGLARSTVYRSLSNARDQLTRDAHPVSPRILQGFLVGWFSF
ncbi:MAG: hypothetical protein ACR2HJ_04440 [Fimbriimonadales bacterium]